MPSPGRRLFRLHKVWDYLFAKNHKPKSQPTRLACEPLEERIVLSFSTDPNIPLAAGTTPLAVALPQLSTDSLADLAILGTDGQLTTAINNGDNSWRPTITTDLGVSQASGFAFGYLDGDLYTDLVVQTPSGLLVGSGDGTGQFTNFRTISLGTPGSLSAGAGVRIEPAVGYLDTDPYADVVTVAPGTNEVIVLHGDGKGGFSSVDRFASGGQQPVSVQIGSFVGDAAPDLAVGHRDGSVTFFQGRGDGTFTPRPDLVVTGLGTITGLTTADLNGDGQPDIGVSATDHAYWLQNSPQTVVASPIINGDFTQGLTGWTKTSGTVSGANGVATFTEDSKSLLSTIRQTFVIPAGAESLTFDLSNYGLVSANGGIPDAFEASLVSGDTTSGYGSIVPTFRSDGTSYFTINPNHTVGMGSTTSFDGTHVTLDVSQLANQQVTLIFHLVGNPPGLSSVVGIDNVALNFSPVAPDHFAVNEFEGPFTNAGGIATGYGIVVVADGDKAVVFNGSYGEFTRDEYPIGTWGSGLTSVALAPLTAEDYSDDAALGLSSGTVLTPLTVSAGNPDHAPRLAPVNALTGTEGTPVTLTAPFTDVDANGPYTATINWGDGTASSTVTASFSGGHGTVNATHTYADNGTYPITVVLHSASDGPSAFQTTSATILNVAPDVTPASVVMAPNSTAEVTLGTFTDLGFTSADLSTRETFLATINWGDGTPTPFGRLQVTNGSAGTLTTGTVFGSHRYTASGTYVGSITVVDDDGGTTTKPLNILVTNGQIQVHASNISGNEGSSVNFTATFSSPAPADTHTATINWGDGTSSDGTITVVSGVPTVTASHVYADNKTYAITLTVTDSANVSGSATASAVIANVPPTITAAASQSVLTGQSMTFDLATFTDPGFTFAPAGTQETFTATVDWGDGTGPANVAVTQGSAGVLTSGSITGTHTYATAGTYTVLVTLHDDNGGTATATLTITVNSSVPVVTVSDLSGTEGSSVNLTATFTDLPAGENHTASINWGDGTSSTGTISTVSGVQTVTGNHVYADNGLYSITVAVTDEAGHTGTGTAVASIANVAPTVTAAANQSVETGQTVTLSLGSFTDPGFTFATAGTHETFTGTIDWGDGMSTADLVVTQGSAGVLTIGTIGGTHKYAAPGNYPVVLTVTDDDGGTGTATLTISAYTAAPVVTSAPDVSGTEGSPVNFTATFSDSTPNESHTATIAWGDGTSSAGTVSVVAGVPTVTGSHVYADNGSYTITLTVIDAAGHTGSANATATITNAAPTVMAAANQSVSATQSFTIPVATFTDPGFTFATAGTQETFTATIDWGDGTSTGNVSVTQGSAGKLTTGTVNGTHTYANPGTYTVHVSVNDDDGGTGNATLTITANSVTPIVSASATSGTEGKSVPLTATFTDGPAGESHTASIAWGDGTTSAGTITTVGGVQTVSGSHIYADNGNYSVTVTVTDAAGHSGSATTTALIGNVAPTVTPSANTSATAGQPITLNLGSFSDPGFTFATAGTQETFTGSIDWGDGTSSANLTVTQGSAGVLTTGTISGTHTYALAGVYTVQFTITDDDGGARTGSLTITVNPAVSSKFFVTDQSAHKTFRYAPDGTPLGSSNESASATRGIATNAAGDTLWVVDGNKNVYVYSASGTPLGSWAAGSINQPQDIATDGTNIWIVDDSKNRVQFFANAASRRSGSQSASGGFDLNSANKNASGLVVRDGYVWVTNDSPGNQNDKVFVYTTGGTLVGSWELDPANRDSSGITLNPSGGNDMWVVDRQDAKVYHYAGATAWTSGSHTATDSFALASGDQHPEGIADPAPYGWAEIADPAPQPPNLGASNLTDITPAGQLEFQASYYDWNQGYLNTQVRLTNIGTAVMTSPVFARFDPITPPLTSQEVAFGTTELGVNGLATGQSSSYVSLAFRVAPDATLGSGNRFAFNVTLLTPENHAPVFGTVPTSFHWTPITTATAGQPFSDAVVATDQEGDPITYALVDGPADMTVNSQTGAIAWTPTTDDLGTHAITIEISDGKGGSTEQTYDLHVTSANQAPSIRGTPSVTTVLPGGAFSYFVDAVDLDGDPLTYSLTTAPVGAAITPDGLLTWAASLAPGEYPVVLAVTDPNGGKATQGFTLTVTAESAGSISGVKYGTGAAGQNLIVNGDFEQGNTGFTTDVLPWEVVSGGGYVVGTDPQTYNPLATSFGDHTTGSGNMLILNPPQELTTLWEETVTVDPSTNYAFNLWAASWYPLEPAHLQVFINGIPLEEELQLSDQTGRWDNLSAVWNSGSATTATIQIVDQTLGFYDDFAFDDISFNVLAGTPDWTIYLDQNGNNKLDPGEPTTVTASDGSYSFPNLPPGTYRVREVPKPGWTQLQPDTKTSIISVSGGASVAGVDLVNRPISPTENHPPVFDPINSLVVPASSSSGGNGVFQYGGGFPTQTVDYPNYWVDVVFQPDNGFPAASLWTDATTPTTPSADDSSDIEVGLKFQSTEAGEITGLRFYKGEGNTGTHVGHLWDSAGNLLASATFTDETATGWQEVTLSTPVHIDADTIYIASYHAPNGHYAIYGSYFAHDYVSTPPNEAAVGELYQFTGTATDPDGEAVTYQLVNAPTGMTVDPDTGRVTWVPAFDQVGRFDPILQAVDGLGATASLPMTIYVAAARGFAITSTPNRIATVGESYSYQLATTASAEQPATFTLLDAPAGLTLDPITGLLSGMVTTPGSVRVTIQANDRAGNQALQSFVLSVREVNTPPVVTAPPNSTLTAGSRYHNMAIAGDLEDGFVFSLGNGAPAGLTIDPHTGIMRWATTSDDTGVYPVTVLANDDRGSVGQASFTITVQADTTAPQVAIFLQYDGEANAYAVNVPSSDDVGVVSQTLTLNGEPFEEGAFFEPSGPGTYDFVATVTDAAGNVGTATYHFVVRDNSDNDPPVIDITSPQPDDSVTYLTDVVGTITDANLDNYIVEISRYGSDQWTQIASGTANITDGLLATIDPTLLDNDAYVVRITATDINGQTATAEVMIQVSAQAKIGNFHQEFTDLQIPLAGIPITITRVYDTLKADQSGDFGYGWMLGAGYDPRVHETLPVNAEAEQQLGMFAATPFKDGTRVYVNTPDGKRVGFTFEAKPYDGVIGNLGGPTAGLYEPYFKPDPGVFETLAGEDDGEGEFKLPLVKVGDDYHLAAIGTPYNPLGYRLTTKDGLAYHFSQFTGLQDITDRNGNTLTFTPDGITSSTGVSITFTRDDQGRITKITDPNGKDIIYSYDANGDLVGLEDQEGTKSQHAYSPTRAHYLIDINNATGGCGCFQSAPPMRMEYDDNGRLILTADQLGDATHYNYDLDANTEVVLDGLNQPTTLVYDDRGNVLSSTDPMGHATVMTYDSNDNELSMTDPNGHTSSYTYDDRGNQTSTTDAIGDTTTTDYNSLNLPTRKVDANGNVYLYNYDSRGNLIEGISPPVDGVNPVVAEYTYDSQGDILTSTDGRGDTIAFEYAGGFPLPVGITNADGTSGSAVYDFMGRLLDTEDENGHLTIHQWDDSGRLVKVTDPTSGFTAYTYDGNKLTSATDSLGRTTTYEYDAADRLSKETDPDGSTIEYEYNGNGDLIRKTDGRGHDTLYSYRPDRKLSSITDPMGGLTSYGYDDAGNLTSVTDANGHTTSYAYDDANRLASTTAADGGITLYVRDANGNVLSLTDPLLHTTQYAYDAYNRVIQTTDAENGVSSSSYDAAGNLVSMTDQNGHTTDYGYDSRNRLETTTDPAGQITTNAYNPAGNLVSITDPLGRTTSFTYDGSNRLLTQTDAAGGVQHDAYDTEGQLTETIDERNFATDYEYDPMGRLSQVTDARAGVTQYGYDANGNQTSVTDPDGNKTSFNYDANDRLIQDTDARGKSRAYEYDPVGNLTAETDRDGRRREFTYDPMDRKTSEAWKAAGGATVYSANYTYDLNGNQLTASDNSSDYAMSYDNLDRMTQVDNAGTPNVPHVVLNYGYDAAGNQISVTDNSGVQVDSQYDPRNLLTQETWQGGGIAAGRVDMGYDGAGQRVSVDRFADLAGTQVVANTIQGYDPVGRLTQRTTTAANGAGIVDYRYTFDPAGDVTSQLDHGQTTNYTYDSTGQLASVTSTNHPNQAFVYDPAGNHTGNGQTIDTANRVTSDAQFDYAYNDEGNLTSKAERATGNVTTFTYDFRNRLTEAVEKTSGGSVLSDTLYTYDVFDRVIARDVNGQRLVTIYNGTNPWADYHGSGNVAARYLYGSGADEILARWRPSDGQAWYLADKQGSVRDIIDSSGAVVGHLEYDGFGKILAATGAVDRFSFQGREWEAALGQYQFRARFYDPDLRQFTSEDPLGFDAGDANLRRFVANNPLTGSDPSGLTETTEESALHGGIAAALRSYGHCLLQSAMITSAIGLATGTKFTIKDLGVQATLCVIPAVFAGLDKANSLLPRPSCFPLGTPIHTADGLKAIETIVAGDRVWAYDHKGLQWVVRHVVETFITEHQGAMATLRLQGETIRATGGHPFWVVRGKNLAERPTEMLIPPYELGGRQEGRWVLACDLCVGDDVLLRDGRVVPVEFVQFDDITEQVYNFHVAELQNYAVGERGILVHNTNSTPKTPTPFENTNQGREEARAIRAINNVIRQNLKRGPKGDIAAVVTESLGGLIPHTSKPGQFHNHIPELENTIRALENNIKVLEHSTLPGAQKAIADAKAALQEIFESLGGLGL